MSNYIAKDTKRYIVEPFLRQVHNPNNRLFCWECGICLGIVLGIVLIG